MRLRSPDSLLDESSRRAEWQTPRHQAGLRSYLELPLNLSLDGAPLRVVVLGDDAFRAVLDQTLRGKTVNRRPIEVRRAARITDATPCHVLFVDASERRRLAEILRAVGHTACLTVGDTDDFLSAGGIVNFVLENNRVRFEINAGAARRTGLRISSKLLSLARAVTN